MLFLLFLALFLYLAAFAVVFIRFAVLGAATEGTTGAVLAFLLELSAAFLFYFFFPAHGKPFQIIVISVLSGHD